MSTSSFEQPSGSSNPKVPKNNSGKAGNIVFVDAVFGNDKTGQPFDSNLPFATINAAITAAIPFTSVNPIEVFIRPGIYNEGQILMANLVSLRGSGRLVTQIFGFLDTSNVAVGQESTALELSINAVDMPAIIGKGQGETIIRCKVIVNRRSFKYFRNSRSYVAQYHFA